MFLKKGEGKLCSDYHGDTKFAQHRRTKIIKEQIERERKEKEKEKEKIDSI